MNRATAPGTFQGRGASSGFGTVSEASDLSPTLDQATIGTRAMTTAPAMKQRPLWSVVSVVESRGFSSQRRRRHVRLGGAGPLGSLSLLVEPSELVQHAGGARVVPQHRSVTAVLPGAAGRADAGKSGGHMGRAHAADEYYQPRRWRISAARMTKSVPRNDHVGRVTPPDVCQSCRMGKQQKRHGRPEGVSRRPPLGGRSCRSAQTWRCSHGRANTRKDRLA